MFDALAKSNGTRTAWRAGGVSPPVFSMDERLAFENRTTFFHRGVRGERGEIQMPIDKIHSHKTGECIFE
ncbi:MAG: hypothetical protein Tsb009_00570 [Planctomycetaceae bacterium]